MMSYMTNDHLTQQAQLLQLPAVGIGQGRDASELQYQLLAAPFPGLVTLLGILSLIYVPVLMLHIVLQHYHIHH